MAVKVKKKFILIMFFYVKTTGFFIFIFALLSHDLSAMKKKKLVVPY